MKSNIEVSYDGSYPTLCFGTLIIKQDGKEIYNEKYCCNSKGSVYFDSNWNEVVEGGPIVWDENDAAQFSEEIQEAVRDVLPYGCCGGCI